MKSYLLQDWTTIRTDAAAAATNIAQPAALWLDIGRVSDLTFFLELSQRTGGTGTRLRYETSPLRDSTAFQELALVNLASVPTTTITALPLYASPAVPPARWLRWRLTSDVSATWDVTFRLTVMAYAR